MLLLFSDLSVQICMWFPNGWMVKVKGLFLWIGCLSTPRSASKHHFYIRNTSQTLEQVNVSLVSDLILLRIKHASHICPIIKIRSLVIRNMCDGFIFLFTMSPVRRTAMGKKGLNFIRGSWNMWRDSATDSLSLWFLARVITRSGNKMKKTTALALFFFVFISFYVLPNP